jgi:ribosomal protein L37AE/L43A
MSETPPSRPADKPISKLRASLPNADQVLCERCGSDMYRMHAVWRCTKCGYKTDCCGW